MTAKEASIIAYSEMGYSKTTIEEVMARVVLDNPCWDWQILPEREREFIELQKAGAEFNITEFAFVDPSN